jgi:hypothetical protein
MNTLPNPPTPHEFAVLRVLRADAERLPRVAARMAGLYLAQMDLPERWHHELMRSLAQRADGVECVPVDVLVATLGRPGAWLPSAYQGDATDARYWLEGLRERAAEYVHPRPALA